MPRSKKKKFGPGQLGQAVAGLTSQAVGEENMKAVAASNKRMKMPGATPGYIQRPAPPEQIQQFAQTAYQSVKKGVDETKSRQQFDIEMLEMERTRREQGLPSAAQESLDKSLKAQEFGSDVMRPWYETPTGQQQFIRQQVDVAYEEMKKLKRQLRSLELTIPQVTDPQRLESYRQLRSFVYDEIARYRSNINRAMDLLDTPTMRVEMDPRRVGFIRNVVRGGFVKKDITEVSKAIEDVWGLPSWVGGRLATLGGDDGGIDAQYERALRDGQFDLFPILSTPFQYARDVIGRVVNVATDFASFITKTIAWGGAGYAWKMMGVPDDLITRAIDELYEGGAYQLPGGLGLAYQGLDQIDQMAEMASLSKLAEIGEIGQFSPHGLTRLAGDVVGWLGVAYVTGSASIIGLGARGAATAAAQQGLWRAALATGIMEGAQVGDETFRTLIDKGEPFSAAFFKSMAATVLSSAASTLLNKAGLLSASHKSAILHEVMSSVMEGTQEVSQQYITDLFAGKDSANYFETFIAGALGGVIANRFMNLAGKHAKGEAETRDYDEMASILSAAAEKNRAARTGEVPVQEGEAQSPFREGEDTFDPFSAEAEELARETSDELEAPREELPIEYMEAIESPSKSEFIVDALAMPQNVPYGYTGASLPPAYSEAPQRGAAALERSATIEEADAALELGKSIVTGDEAWANDLDIFDTAKEFYRTGLFHSPAQALATAFADKHNVDLPRHAIEAIMRFQAMPGLGSPTMQTLRPGMTSFDKKRREFLDLAFAARSLLYGERGSKQSIIDAGKAMGVSDKEAEIAADLVDILIHAVSAESGIPAERLYASLFLGARNAGDDIGYRSVAYWRRVYGTLGIIAYSPDLARKHGAATVLIHETLHALHFTLPAKWLKPYFKYYMATSWSSQPAVVDGARFGYDADHNFDMAEQFVADFMAYMADPKRTPEAVRPFLAKVKKLVRGALNQIMTLLPKANRVIVAGKTGKAATYVASEVRKIIDDIFETGVKYRDTMQSLGGPRNITTNEFGIPSAIVSVPGAQGRFEFDALEPPNAWTEALYGDEGEQYAMETPSEEALTAIDNAIDTQLLGEDGFLSQRLDNGEFYGEDGYRVAIVSVNVTKKAKKEGKSEAEVAKEAVRGFYATRGQVMRHFDDELILGGWRDTEKGETFVELTLAPKMDRNSENDKVFTKLATKFNQREIGHVADGEFSPIVVDKDAEVVPLNYSNERMIDIIEEVIGKSWQPRPATGGALRLYRGTARQKADNYNATYSAYIDGKTVLLGGRHGRVAWYSPRHAVAYGFSGYSPGEVTRTDIPVQELKSFDPRKPENAKRVAEMYVDLVAKIAKVRLNVPWGNLPGGTLETALDSALNNHAVELLIRTAKDFGGNIDESLYKAAEKQALQGDFDLLELPPIANALFDEGYEAIVVAEPWTSAAGEAFDASVYEKTGSGRLSTIVTYMLRGDVAARYAHSAVGKTGLDIEGPYGEGDTAAPPVRTLPAGKRLFMGSPFSVDEISSGKGGSGEGGTPRLYFFTEDPKIANLYAHGAGGLRVDREQPLIVDMEAEIPDSKPGPPVYQWDGSTYKHIGWADDYGYRIPLRESTLPDISMSEAGATDEGVEWGNSRFSTMRPSAQVHEAQLPDDVRLLDLRTPEGVAEMKRLAPELVREGSTFYDDYFTWRDTKYANLSPKNPWAKTWDAAIAKLREAGYGGIQYYDDVSMMESEATRTTIALFDEPIWERTQGLVSDDLSAEYGRGKNSPIRQLPPESLDEPNRATVPPEQRKWSKAEAAHIAAKAWLHKKTYDEYVAMVKKLYGRKMAKKGGIKTSWLKQGWKKGRQAEVARQGQIAVGISLQMIQAGKTFAEVMAHLKKMKADGILHVATNLDLQEAYAIAAALAGSPVATYKHFGGKGLNKRVRELPIHVKGVTVPEYIAKEAEQWRDLTNSVLDSELRSFQKVAGDKSEAIDWFITFRENATTAIAIRLANYRKRIRKEVPIVLNKKASVYVMMYGEKKITLAELKKQRPKDWQKIVEAAAWFRKEYDALFKELNETFTRLGLPTVDYRADYFTHFREQAQIWEAIFGDYTSKIVLGGPSLASFIKPIKGFNPWLKRRIDEGTPVFDALGAFEAYLRPTMSDIHLTEVTLRRRALAKMLRHGQEDSLGKFIDNLERWANVYTRYPHEIDAALDRTIGAQRVGKKVTTGKQVRMAVRWLLGRHGMNQILGNLSTVFVQTGQLPLALATFGPWRVARAFLEQAAAIESGDEGIVALSKFLARRYAVTKTARPSVAQHGADVAAFPLLAVESNVTKSIWRAAHRFVTEAWGLSGDEAITEADRLTEKIVAGRELGEMPAIFHSAWGQVLMQFQLEPGNTLKFLGGDLTRLPGKGKLPPDALQKIGRILAFLLSSYLINKVYEATIGRSPVIDPVQAAVDAYEVMQNPDRSIGVNAVYALARLAGEPASQVPGAQAAINLLVPEKYRREFFGRTELGLYSGGIPVANLIRKPIEGFAAEGYGGLGKELLFSMILPFGGQQIKKTYEGTQAARQGGVKDKEGKEMYDVSGAPDTIRAILFGPSATKSARDYYRERELGRKKGESTTPLLDRILERASKQSDLEPSSRLEP